jgi:hypothetical protein
MDRPGEIHRRNRNPKNQRRIDVYDAGVKTDSIQNASGAVNAECDIAVYGVLKDVVYGYRENSRNRELCDALQATP